MFAMLGGTCQVTWLKVVGLVVVVGGLVVPTLQVAWFKHAGKVQTTASFDWPMQLRF